MTCRDDTGIPLCSRCGANSKIELVCHMFVLVLVSTTGRGIPALSVKVILACTFLASVCAWDMQKRVWEENLLKQAYGKPVISHLRQP